MLNWYLWLQSRTRFWTAVSVDASFWPVTKCLSTTTCTESGWLAAKLAPRSRTASSGMTARSAKSGNRASSNTDDWKERAGSVTWTFVKSSALKLEAAVSSEMGKYLPEYMPEERNLHGQDECLCTWIALQILFNPISSHGITNSVRTSNPTTNSVFYSISLLPKL
jgi:hypothetical protein